MSLTTYGSSSCPNVPVGVEVSGPQRLHVRVAEDHSESRSANDGIAYVCTDDLGPTTSVVELPEGIDPQAQLTIVVSGDDRETRSVVVPGA